MTGFYLLGEAGGKLLPQTLQLPPQIFVTSSTFYIVVEVGPTLVSRMPQLLHHMGRSTPSSPCVLPYLRLNTDSFSPKFQILYRTLDDVNLRNRLTILRLAPELDGTILYCGTGAMPKTANFSIKIYRKSICDTQLTSYS